MQDGLAVEADQVGLPPERRHRAHMVFRQPGFCALQAPVGRIQGRREVEDAAQVSAQAVVVGQCQCRAECADALAVGLQPSRIDAVQRGPAHQSDRAQHSLRGFPWGRVCASPQAP